MSTKIDGKQIAAEIKTNLAERVNKLKAQGILRAVCSSYSTPMTLI